MAVLLEQMTTPSQAPADIQDMIDVAFDAAAGNIPNLPTVSSNTEWKVTLANGWIYCWFHIFLRNKNHNSTSFENKKTGHISDATIEGKMGGGWRVGLEEQ